MQALRQWHTTTLLGALIPIATWILAWYAGVPYLLVLGVVVVCVLVNAVLAELDDDVAGGLNNPDGTETPLYMRVVAAVGRWAAALIIGVGGIWTFAAPPEPQALIAHPLVRAALAFGCGLLAIGLASRRFRLKAAGVLAILGTVLVDVAVQRWWHAG